MCAHTRVQSELTTTVRFTVFVSQTLAVLPDQDSFYDVTDSLEQLGIETVIQKHMNNKGTEPELKAQFSVYEVTTSVTLTTSCSTSSQIERSAQHQTMC